MALIPFSFKFNIISVADKITGFIGFFVMLYGNAVVFLDSVPGTIAVPKFQLFVNVIHLSQKFSFFSNDIEQSSIEFNTNCRKKTRSPGYIILEVFPKFAGNNTT